MGYYQDQRKYQDQYNVYKNSIKYALRDKIIPKEYRKTNKYDE